MEGDMGPPQHSQSPPGSSSAHQAASRKSHKRSTRACLTCRKLKKVCEGATATSACHRCANSGNECVFDKPQSHIIDDAGLDRLSAIESLLLAQDSQLKTLVATVGDLTNRLAEVSASPNSHNVSSSQHGSPTHRIGTPNSGHSYLPQVSSSSVQDPLMALRSTLLNSASPAAPHSMPDRSGGDSFARRLHMPIAALAEAADRASRSDEDQHQTKRVKLDPMTVKPIKDRAQRPDAVAKGVIPDREARGLVMLWHKELLPFCAVLNPDYDTYDSMRRRSTFLFNTVLYTAARSFPSGAAELAALAEETRELAQTAIFEPNPPLENIQAVLLMACWHEEPYLLSGYALRMALASKVDTALDQLDPSNQDDPETLRQLQAQIRAWLISFFFDWKNSASTGRTPLRSLEDLMQVEQSIDKMLATPGCTIFDIRTVAAFRQTVIQRSIMQRAGELANALDVEKAAYVEQVHRVFLDWFERHDAMLASYGAAPLSWPRRSHLRQLHDSYCFLACTVFRSRLLDRDRSPQVEHIAEQTLQAARASLTVSLDAPAYRDSIRFSGFITRVELSFAGLLALKLAPNDAQIAEEASAIADVLAECFGSMKAANALRFALRSRPSTTQDAKGFTEHTASHDSTLLPGEALIDWNSLTGPPTNNNTQSGQPDWILWHSDPLAFPFCGPHM